MISSVTLMKNNVAKRLSVSGKTLVETTIHRTPTDGEFMYKMVRNGYLSKGWRVQVKPLRLAHRSAKKSPGPTSQKSQVMDLPFKEEP